MLEGLQEVFREALTEHVSPDLELIFVESVAVKTCVFGLFLRVFRCVQIL